MTHRVEQGSPTWERVERLDPDQAVEGVYAETGLRFEVLGSPAGGQVGVALVRWPESGGRRRSILKWRPHSRLESFREGPAAVSELVRRAGVPAPAVELLVQVRHAVVMVCELLPGEPVSRLDASLLEQALLVLGRLRNLLVDRPDLPSVELHLSADGPGYCLHEPLRRHSARSAALERRILSVGRRFPPTLSGGDAVHLDFHPGNLLALEGVLSGVVDWDGAARGDRTLDLVGLRFGVHRQAPPAVVDRLDDLLDALPTDVLQACWAHQSLRMVDWAIRHHSAAEVDVWLDLAGQRL